MTTLSEIRDAIGDQTISVATLAASGLTFRQKTLVGVAMLNSRLPITITTIRGQLTVTRLANENDHLYIYGSGVINDAEFQNAAWRVGIHPLPLFVPDASSTDKVNVIGDPVNVQGVAATDVFTAASAHGLTDGMQIGGAQIGVQALPGGFSTTTVYWVINSTATTFKLSLTQGGAAVDVSSNGVVRVAQVSCYRLDPVQAARDILADIVKGQQ